MLKHERRKSPRIDVDLVTVEVYDSIHYDSEAHVAEICNVCNISENGMQFTAEHPFYKQQVLRLTFLLPESIIIIRTDAIVAYVKKHITKENVIGVQFQNLPQSTQNQIRHFINKLIVEKSL